MLDRVRLARYLRQRAELGERELFLDGISAQELLAALAPGPRPRAGSRQDGEAVGRREGETGTSDSAAGFARVREVLHDAATEQPAWMPAQAGAGRPGARGRQDSTPRPPAIWSAPSEGSHPGEAAALRVLSAEASQCTACRLSAGRHSVVFGEGHPAAQLVIVGEAPGQEEDRTGRPFVGQAGRLLDLLLLTAGFPRDQVYICNTLKCRPPQNRNPLPDELAACSRFLKGQLGVIQPKVVLAVGKFAAQSLVGSEESISRLRGRIFRYEGIPLVVSYHPAFLLRSPQWTRTAWEDFQLARRVLDEQA